MKDEITREKKVKPPITMDSLKSIYVPCPDCGQVIEVKVSNDNWFTAVHQENRKILHWSQGKVLENDVLEAR